MRRSLLLVLLVAALVRPAAAVEGGVAEIQRVLDRRAGALLAGDRAAFLGVLDPMADRAFVERQANLFDGFSTLGLASYETEVAEGFAPPGLATDRERSRYRGPVAILPIEERHALQGWDAEPALEDLILAFVRRPGGWRIASDTDLDDVTLWSARKLWEEGPIATRESEHFLFVSHPDLTGAAGPVLEAAEAGLEVVRDRWPLGWRPRVVILAPSTQEELGRLIQASFDLDAFVAFASSGVDREDGWDLNGHRIYLNWPRFSRYPQSAREAILAHELLHIATRDLAGPFTTTFVDEGVAEWVAGASTSILDARVAEGAFDRSLPEDVEFLTGTDAEIGLAYQEAYSAIRFAAEEHGGPAVAEFYRALGRVRVAPGTWRYHVGRAMRSAFGVGYGPFQRAWADHIEETR